MTTDQHAALDRTVRLWRVVTALAVFVATTGLLTILGLLYIRAEHTACIDRVEVDWRIATGDGLVHLVDEDEPGLVADIEALNDANDRLREIDAGTRC